MPDMFDSRRARAMLIADNKPPFDSADYIYGLKLDGERGIAYLDKDMVELHNKRQNLMLSKFPELADIHKQVCSRCILDGEYIVADAEGKPDFAEVARRSITTDPSKISMATN